MTDARPSLPGWLRTTLVALLLLATAFVVEARAEIRPGPERGPLLWSEDFTPRLGCPIIPPFCAVDTRRWSYDVGATGWGNGELQEYTSSPANSRLRADGTLQIVTRPSTGPAPYTSARLVTRNKVAVGYGYVEAKIKLPAGPASGLWPAFWLRSNGEPWPDGGEIDVMETVNGNWGHSTTIHGGGTHHWQNYRWHSSGAVNDGRWHTYGVLLRPERLIFYHDGVPVHSITKAQTPEGGVWPFDVANRRYYMILNMAMGGSYPGTPDGTAPLPATMTVDYVRYWALKGTTGPTDWLGDSRVRPHIRLQAPSRISHSARSRPTMRVTVSRRGVPVTGRIRVQFLGHTARVVTVRHGRANVAVPRLPAGRRTIRVTFLGNTTTTARTVARTVRVVRR